MERRKAIGVLGAVVFAAGLFCPFAFSARFGPSNMLEFSGGELAAPMMVIAVMAFVLTLTGKYRWLRTAGLVSVGTVFYALYAFHTTSQLVDRVNDLVDRFGGKRVTAVELDFGWIVLMLGGVLVVVAGYYDSVFERN